jgi:drug/metabolite transporter (DMT)-like permease
MKKKANSNIEVKRIAAIIESISVMAIWASSFVFVKVGLDCLGPLTIAGLRYFLGFLILLPFLIRKGRSTLPLSGKLWLRLFAIGISAYTIGNGALFWGLKYLPATTVSFLMSLSPLLILMGGIVWLDERPSGWQLFGVFVSLAGSGLFFSSGLQSGETIGLLIVFVGLIGFTSFGLLGREIARVRKIDTLTLTTIPLAIGGGLLLIIALPLEGIPQISGKSLGIVLWLAIVNTAVAYMIYNHALQTLTALEMNVVLNLTPLGTALLARFFLGESLSTLKLTGMIVMIIGVIFVQRLKKSRPLK